MGSWVAGALVNNTRESGGFIYVRTQGDGGKNEDNYKFLIACVFPECIEANSFVVWYDHCQGPSRHQLSHQIR